MKNIFFNQISFAATAALIVLLSFSSCSKDKNDAAPAKPAKKTATLNFSGANEVPANSSTGTGSGQVSFDPAAKTITYNVSWKLGLPAATTTDMHFHGAEDGSDTKSSPVVVELEGFSTGNSGNFSGITRVLTDAEVNQLLAGKWYMNIHSTTVPGGELRANIKF
jgi:hypothetical protein